MSKASKSEPSESTQHAVAAGKALGHEIRVELLCLMRGRDTLTPAHASRRLELPIGRVAFHFGVLEQLGVIRLARTRQVGGSIAHYFALASAQPASAAVLALLAHLDEAARVSQTDVVPDGARDGDRPLEAAEAA